MCHRLSWAVVAIVLMTGAAFAQGPRRGMPAPPTVSPPAILLPSTTVLPSPTTVLRPSTPPPPGRSDLYLARPFTYAPRFDRLHRPLAGYGAYGAWSGWANDYAAMPADAVAPGYLQVVGQPADAQVFVDGLYIGVVDDLQRTIPGRALDPGAHHIDVRATGYDPTSADIRIDPDETTLYRAELRRSAPAGAPGPTPVEVGAAPRTFYVIDGCYAGDRPPQQDRLPRGCKATAVRTIPPVLSHTAARPPRS